MAESILGLDFDIHGGGSDLIFPHHENEIAQTEAGRGRPLSRLWMHNGMIRFGEEKMAKSVGNVTRLADALDDYGRDALIENDVELVDERVLRVVPEEDDVGPDRRRGSIREDVRIDGRSGRRVDRESKLARRHPGVRDGV